MYIPQIIFIAVVVSSSLFDYGSTLSCNCNNPEFKVECAPPTGCKGGLVKDACGCCDVCAKVEEESCGGPWNIGGRCDKDLTCVKKDQRNFNAKGVCMGKPSLSAPAKPLCRVNKRLNNFPDWFCKQERRTYCTRDCERCCMHTNSCNPDPYRLYPAEERCERFI